MTNRRGGATTSLVLGIAGVIGVGVAGGMALTGITPCSIMSACDAKSEAPAAQTVALTDEATACPVTGRAGAITAAATSSEKSDCCASKAAETAKAQTVALTEHADCSGDPECAIDDGVACSTKGADCHKVQPAADSVQVHVITASQTAAKAEECAMASSCSPANCTEGMMKACTDSGKICPEDKSATPATPATPAAPAAPAAQTVANETKADCCADKAQAEAIVVAPGALRPLYALQFSGKGMPMLIPAAMTNQSACETKEAGSCDGEKKADCAAAATTAALN